MAADRLLAIRERVQNRLRGNADLIYRQSLTFRLGPHAWEARCSVKDPQKLKADEVGKLRLYADANGLTYTDLRQIKVHPDDIEPFPGASVAFDDGTLEVLDWSQVSDFTGRRTGTAVLRRP